MRRLLTLSLFVTLYVIRLYLQHITPSSIPSVAATPVQVRFILLDYPIASGKTYRYTWDHLVLEWSQYPSLKLGEWYQVAGQVTASQQLGLTLKTTLSITETNTLLGPPPNLAESILIAIARFRHQLTSTLSQALPEPESSLAAGILLGVKRELGYEFRKDLIQSGTLHTVAASGYNVNLVASFLLSITSSFIPRFLAFIFSSLGIIFFCILAGGGAAVVRAGVMGILILVGWGLGRQRAALRLLFLAAYLLLLLDPLYLFDVSYQLSVAATFGILYLEPILRLRFARILSLTGLGSLLRDYFLPTLAASLFTLPITYFTFGEATLWGLLSNPLLLPFIPLIMLLTSLFLLVSHYVPPLATLISLPLYLLLHYYTTIVKIFGSL